MYESYRIQKSQKRLMMQSVIPTLRDSVPLLGTLSHSGPGAIAETSVHLSGDSLCLINMLLSYSQKGNTLDTPFYTSFPSLH